MSPAFRHPLRVRFHECDPQGAVFNANYLAYFDIAITELWREAFGGWDEAMADMGLDAVVAEARCRYLAPLRFDEEIEVVATRHAAGRHLDDHDLHGRALWRGGRRGRAAPRLRRRDDAREATIPDTIRVRPRALHLIRLRLLVGNCDICHQQIRSFRRSAARSGLIRLIDRRDRDDSALIPARTVAASRNSS